MSDSSSQLPDHGEQIATRERTVTKRPRRYRVVLHNDDFTSMEFVIHVLKEYFHRSDSEANRIMLEVHHKGAGTAGIYTYDVAETKVAQVTSEARENGMPLMLSVEAE
ncbi:MAG: ATP-dependent Clp protease adaptor ClpS [Deltaproteobacteria bacterium]|nr:ATP-dependent Clp protease adaptor ClpS [Deltaproteobacteria bacterium]